MTLDVKKKTKKEEEKIKLRVVFRLPLLTTHTKRTQKKTPHTYDLIEKKDDDDDDDDVGHAPL